MLWYAVADGEDLRGLGILSNLHHPIHERCRGVFIGIPEPDWRCVKRCADYFRDELKSG